VASSASTFTWWWCCAPAPRGEGQDGGGAWDLRSEAWSSSQADMVAWRGRVSGERAPHRDLDGGPGGRDCECEPGRQSGEVDECEGVRACLLRWRRGECYTRRAQGSDADAGRQEAGHEEESTSASASTSKQRRETESEKADSGARPTDGSCAPLLPRGRAATACGNLTNGPDLCDLVCL
jgi:hypothetical protein